MSLAAHVSMLKDKHVKLKKIVEEESQRPAPDFTVIQSLKKQKLLIKEELERITSADTLRQSGGAA